jgi:hypothetical protein
VEAWLLNLGIIETGMESSADYIVCAYMNVQTHAGFVMYVHV